MFLCYLLINFYADFKLFDDKKNRYVHAELHGASSTVIKNHKPDNPVPPLTLNQAGYFRVSNNQQAIKFGILHVVKRVFWEL